MLQKGSLVRYRVYFKLQRDTDVDRLVGNLAPKLQQLRLEADTVSKRSESIAASMENLSRYLTLAVFIAVLLSGVGVASVVHVFATVKARSAALLRCIGAAPRETVCVYVIQVLSLAFISSLLGTALGVAAQFALPLALKDFLPLTTVVSLAPRGIIAGWAVGLGTTLLVRSDSVTAAAKYLAAVGAARDLRCRPAGARLADMDFIRSDRRRRSGLLPYRPRAT